MKRTMSPRRERQYTKSTDPPTGPSTTAQPQEEEDTVAQRLEGRQTELLQKRQLESI